MTIGRPCGHDKYPMRHFILSPAQRIAWLRLIRTENVGPVTFRDLINQCGSAENALAMLPDIVGRTGRKRYLHTPSQSEAEDELAAIERHGAQLVGIGEDAYPPLLRIADSPPPLVTMRGNPAVFKRHSVSIVGARNASMSGINMARKLSRDLAKADYPVVSGLARGIDCAAHEAALERGTVAVLAGGHSKPYPPENIALLQSIEDGGMGASISEMPFGWEPRAKDFPRRNRIVAALSMGLVVVEAAKRSGSLISARLAAEMGRTVFAVPGSPLDPRSAGTNQLIRNGATLITNAEEIIVDLRPVNTDPDHGTNTLLSEEDQYMPLPPDDDDRARIMTLLSPSPTDVDDLIAHSGLTAGQVMLILLEADLAGLIERHSGNRVSRIFQSDP